MKKNLFFACSGGANTPPAKKPWSSLQNIRRTMIMLFVMLFSLGAWAASTIVALPSPVVDGDQATYTYSVASEVKIKNITSLLVEIPSNMTSGTISVKGSGSNSSRYLYIHENGSKSSTGIVFSTTYADFEFGSDHIVVDGTKHYLEFSTSHDYKINGEFAKLVTAAPDCTMPMITWNVEPAGGEVGDADFVASVTTTPADHAVTWTSSNEAVATVSNGTIHYVAPGVVEIKASMTYSGSDYCETTVSVSKDILVPISAITPSENDRVWYYQTAIPSSNPDNGLNYGGTKTGNGLYGIKLNSSGYAWFAKPAVAGTLRVGAYIASGTVSEYIVNVFACDAEGNKQGDALGTLSTSAPGAASATMDIASDVAGIYINRNTGTEGVLYFIEFVAAATPPAATYSVTYKANGSSEADVVRADVSKVEANMFTYAGYQFTGWNTQADGEGTAYAAEDAVTRDLELYAQWAQLYSVTYAAGEGSGTVPTEDSHIAGAKFNAAAQGSMVAPTGKVFAGWKDQDDADVAEGAEYTMPAKNVILTAQWIEAPAARRELLEVVFSNGAKGAINIASQTITVPYIGEAPTYVSSQFCEWVEAGAHAEMVDGKLRAIGADDEYTDYTIVAQELTASAVTLGEEIVFDAVPSYIFAPYGFDVDDMVSEKRDYKGVKFAKNVEEDVDGKRRISSGNSRMYMAIQACDSLILTSGTGGARNVKIYVNGVQSSVTATAAFESNIKILLANDKVNFIAIESNQTSGDGGFIKMQLKNEEVVPTYTITYKAGEGTGDDVVVDDATEVADVPGTFTAPAGKVFDTWKDGEANEYAVGDAVTADLTLIAQWKDAPAPVVCPEVGVVFSMSGLTASESFANISSSNFLPISATYVGGSAEAGTTGSSAKTQANNTSGEFAFNADGAVCIKVSLDCALAEGDIISFTSSAAKEIQLCATINGEYITTANKKYVIPALSSMIGTQELYIKRKESGSLLASLAINRPASITLDATTNGGSVSTSSIAGAVDEIAILPHAFKDGMMFKGWYDAAEGGTKQNDHYTISGNATLYAQFDVLPSSGTLFSFAMEDALKPAANCTIKTSTGFDGEKDMLEYATIEGGSAILYNSSTSNHGIITTTPTVKFAGGNAYLLITLEQVLAVGDKITTNISGQNIAYTNNATRSTANYFTKGNGQVLTLAAGNALVGSKVIYLWAAGSSNGELISLSIDRPVAYSVTYNVNGATGDAPTQADAYEGDKFNVASASGLAKGSLVFDGWLCSADDVVYAAGDEYTMPAANVTFTAQWADKKVVTFNTNGGSEIAAVNVENGQPVAAPAAPTKELYSFVKWQLEGADYDFAAAVTDDITLDAVWAPIYATSFNFGEQSDLTKDNIGTRLADAGYAYSIGTGGSYDDGTTTGYLGYKFKNNGDYVAFLLQDGYEAVVTYGYTQSGWKVNGEDAGVATATGAYVDKTYQAVGSDQAFKLVNQSADGKTSTLSNIVIRLIPVISEDDATLSALSICGVDVDLSSEPYAVEVPFYAVPAEANIVATPTDDDAEVTAIAVDGDKVTVTVTAKDGVTTKDYEVTFSNAAAAYSSSINIEKAILDNSTKYAYADALAAANIVTSGGGFSLDSLNDGKGVYRNNAYLGLKIKNNGSKMTVVLKAGEALNVKLGYITDAINVAINGEAAGTIAANSALDVEPIYALAADAADREVVFTTTTNGTVIFKQIMIDEAIAEVVLPEATRHAVVLASVENGTLAVASPAEYNWLAENVDVTLTVTPDEGYHIGAVTLNGVELIADEGVYAFAMPAAVANVAATFVADAPVDPVYMVVRDGLTPGYFYTMCLDKNVTAARGASFWKPADYNGSSVELEEVTGELEAGIPYFFKATAATLEVVYGDDDAPSAGTNNGLVGSFTEEDIQAGAGNYILYDNKLYEVAATQLAKVGAYRAYINIGQINNVAPAPGMRRMAMPIQHGVATGIDAIEVGAELKKVVIDGQLYIVRDGRMYDVTGQLVR